MSGRHAAERPQRWSLRRPRHNSDTSSPDVGKGAESTTGDSALDSLSYLAWDRAQARSPLDAVFAAPAPLSAAAHVNYGRTT